MAEDSDRIIQSSRGPGPGSGGPVGEGGAPSPPAVPPSPAVPPLPVVPPPRPAGPPPGQAGPPPGPVEPSSGPGRHGPARLLRRHWPLLVAAVVPCLVLAGIGWWLWPEQPAEGPPHIASGTVQAQLLSPDSVSRVAGTTLVAGAQSNRPNDPLKVSPSPCAVAAGPTTRSVYGKEWTAFLSATYRDSGATGAYTVNQVIGVFPDGKKADAAFRTLTEGLSKCESSTRSDQADRTSKWGYETQPATQVAVAWTATQDGSADWSCAHQARVNGANLVQVSVCQAGDGQPTAAKLTDKLARKVSR